MKKIFFFLLFFITFQSFGQMTKIEAGVILGYDRIGVRQWNKSIRAYNSLTTLFPDSIKRSTQSEISGGVSYGIFVAYRIRTGLTIVPQVSFLKFNSKTANLSIKNKTTNFRVGIKFYPFYFFNPRYFTRFKKNFFVEAIPSLSSFSNTTNLYLETINNGTDWVTRISTQRKSKLITLGLGVGYDAFASEKISITPTFQIYLNPKVEIDNFAATLRGRSATDGLKDKNALWDFQLGVRVGYVIKPTLGLCPINRCHVRMEHTHSGLGCQVRGSRLAFKQNRRIGEKYKDVRVIRWLKTINKYLKKTFKKKEKEEEEIQEDTITEPSDTSSDTELSEDETPPPSDDATGGDDGSGGDDGN